LNLKSKKQGFGNYQRDEQIDSEGKVSEFLYWLMENTKTFDEKEDYEKSDWASIRDICRRTGLHHSTARKAIDRLKDKFEVLEVPGTHRSRLFCLSDSPNADYIRTQIKQNQSLATHYGKYNSKEFMKKIMINPKFYENGWLITPKNKSDPTYNRLRKKSDFSEVRFRKIIMKRHLISVKNRRHHDSKS
jgi:hypothetical protein